MERPRNPAVRDTILGDVIFGLRQLRRSPGFAAAAILSLVLGIGLNTAVYTLWDAIFVRPLAVDELDDVQKIYSTRRNDAGEFHGLYSWAWPDFQDLRERSRGFRHLSLHQWTPMNFSGGEEPKRTHGAFTTADYFKILRLEPALGRFFSPEMDDEYGAHPVVVLSHRTWTQLFSQDAAVLGQTVQVNGRGLTVIGVAPAGFRGTEMDTTVDFWLPLSMYPEVGPYPDWFEVRGAALFRVLGRLKEGTTAAQAEEDLMRVARGMEEEFPKEAEGLGARVRPLRDNVFLPRDRERYQGYARTLRTAAALILLICCIDVAHLLLVRGLTRRRELAIRQALGAGQGRITRQLVVENLTLFLVGGLLALPVAYLALGLLWRLRPPQLPVDALDFTPDPRIFGLALLATLGLGLIFGLIPALRASRGEITPQLKDSPPGSRDALGYFSPQRLLVMAQVALALVALIGAGLFLRSLQEAYRIDLGFADEELAVLSFAPGEQGYDEDRCLGFYDQVLEEMSGLPGVRAATLSENRLLRGAIWQRQIFLPNQEEALTIGSRAVHRTNAVVPGFFETVGIPFVRGRDFHSGDRADTQAVAIINQTLAETAWPNEDPIGKRFHYDYPDTPAIEVVGVVRNARYRNVREPSQFFLYHPVQQVFRGSMTVHLRTDEDPAQVLPAARERLRKMVPELPLSDVGPLSRFVDEDLWLDRASARFLGLFGLLALVLAMVGVYGVLTQVVQQRRREIGIRLSLGAPRKTLLRHLMKETLTLVGSGLVLGLILSFLVLRFTTSLTDQLHGVAVVDPVTWAAAALVLLLAALLGGWIPGRRAVHTNPVSVLREE